jgi:hypothetical protein
VPFGGVLINQEQRVCAMSNRMYGALIASLCAGALVCAAGETLAAAPRGLASTHPHSHFHSPFARLHRHHHHNNRNDNFGAVAWPDEGFFGGPGAPGEFPPVIPNDIRNTNAFDIPWDWAHRYPPMVTPSAKPYVSTCPTETIKVPSDNGREQTVNITRCY